MDGWVMLIPALVFDVFGTQDIFDIPIGKQEIPVV